MQLGVLRQLSAQSIASSAPRADAQSEYYEAMQAMMGNRAAAAAGPTPTEAVAAQPSAIEVRVTVNIAFALK